MEKNLPIHEIPYRLKRLRESSKLTQGELAKMCGMSQAQLSAYELGKHLPNLESLDLLAKALGTTIAAIIDEKEPSLAPPRKPDKDEMALWVLESIGVAGFKLDGVRRILGGDLKKF